MKNLLRLCRKFYTNFRHEFDGEVWTIWVYDGEYPEYIGLTGEKCESVLRQLLFNHLKTVETRLVQLQENAAEISEALK